jgi:uncharacterized DUF497 family protein
MDDLYEYLGQVFEWDRMKAARNAIRHRVRFTEAATVFFDDDALFERDPDYSDEENHYVVLGWSIRHGYPDGRSCFAGIVFAE